jgi:hypothetical protein
VSGTAFRLLLAFLAFAGVTLLGFQLTGLTLDGLTVTPAGDPPPSARDPFALVMAAALAAALLAYVAVEQRQTGSLDSLASQLPPRVLVLLPIAVAADIALGAAAANGLALPLPMDSTGTLLIAILAGPFAGALAGFAALTLWGLAIPAPYVLPTAPAFAVVAVLTGLLAGGLVGSGLLRPRPHAGRRAMVVAIGVLLAATGAVAGHAWFLLQGVTEPPLPTFEGADGPLLVLGWIVAFLVVGSAIAAGGRLLFVRDPSVVAVAVSGLVIGALTAIVRTLIVEGQLHGQTGFGFDPWIAAVTAANGDPWISTLRTLLLFEPLDRMLSLLAGWLVVVTLIGVTSRVRYPRGEWLIADDDDFALRVGTSMRATRW